MGNIFLSKTSSPPYVPYPEFYNEDSIIISGRYSMEGTVISENKVIYLIVEDDYYDTIEIRVENEYTTGVSLYISLVDALDKPLHWGKLIQLENVYAPETIYIKKFVYQWRVLDDIYFIKNTRPTARINVYGIREIAT